MKKVLKITAVTIVVLLSIAAVISPIGIIAGLTFFTPSQYENTFYGGLDLKYDRLTSLKEDKIVVVGGSSVAFGLDSALLQDYLGMPVVNFGLYADLGTRLMLDLSRDHIEKGDIVILAPELDAQTLSMYFSWENTLKACDDNMAMLRELDRSIDEWLFSIEGFYELASAKLAYSVNGNTPDPTDIYSAKNFNIYGDLDSHIFPRENNIMKSWRLTDDSYLVDFDPAIVESEFLSYMNEYILECEEKGATVYFSWCPVNDLAVVDPSAEKAAQFEKFFRDNLECEVISSIDNYVLESGYFYDTNFHLNDAGVQVRSLRLLNDLLLYLDPEGRIYVSEEEPDAPEHKYNSAYDGPEDPNSVYFTYEIDEVTGAYKITGLTELGKAQTTLTVPLGYTEPGAKKAFKVTLLNTDIFAGSACRRLIITADSNVGTMEGNFSGATNLKELYIYIRDPGQISKPSSFDGVGQGFVIYVPKNCGYMNHYNWGTSSSQKLLSETLD